jgi:hypothetical protein
MHPAHETQCVVVGCQQDGARLDKMGQDETVDMHRELAEIMLHVHSGLVRLPACMKAVSSFD